MKRIAPAAAALVVIGGIAAWLWIRQSDKRAVAEFQARLDAVGAPIARDPKLASEPNAFELYAQLQAGKDLYSQEKDGKMIEAALTRPWEEMSGPLTDILERAEKELALARRASRLERFDAAPGLDIIKPKTPMPQFSRTVQAMRLLLLSARRSLAYDAPEAAAAEIATVLRMAAQFRREKGMRLLCVLISNLAATDAFAPAGDLLRVDGLSPESLAALREPLRALLGPEPLVEALRQESGSYSAMETLLFDAPMRFVPGGIRQTHGKHLETVWGRVNYVLLDAAKLNEPNQLAELLDALKRKYPGTDQSACPKTPFDLAECAVARAAFPDYNRMIDRYYLAQARIAVLQAAVAVRETGKPGTVADPYAGFRPVRFVSTPAEWKVYSLGPDRADQAGAVVYVEPDPLTWKNPAPGDIVLSFPRAAAAREAEPKKRAAKRRRKAS